MSLPRQRSIVASLFLTLVMICQSFAQTEPPEKPNKQQARARKQMMANVMRPFRQAELTEEQQAQATEIIEKHAEKLAAFQLEADSLFTDEQKKARRDVRKRAREEKLNAKETQAAIAQATGVDEDTLAKFNSIRIAQAKFRVEIQKEIVELLSDEQKEKITNRAITGRQGKRKKKAE